MNLNYDSFLCLDIGTYGVRGLAHIINNARIQKSAIHFIKSPNTVFALSRVIDELEHKLQTRFTSAFITGNFGSSDFKIISDVINWQNEHKISEFDIKHQVLKINITDNFYAMHIIPIFYGTPKIPNIKNSPVGHIDTQLTSVFSVIAYNKNTTKNISNIIRRAYIKSAGFFDPVFLQNEAYRKQSEKTLFIDLGNEFTTFSIWNDRGPLYFNKIKSGQHDITVAISKELKINLDDADTLKRDIVNALPNDMDRFTPAGTSEKFSKFSRADINDIFIDKLNELFSLINKHLHEKLLKYTPTKIILSGGGSQIQNINTFVERNFGLPVENQTENASIKALSEYIWNSQKEERKEYIQKKLNIEKRINKITKLFTIKKHVKKPQIVPILPSSLCFNMKDKITYTMFASGGISMIHVDIMDGFYVNRVAGSIQELKEIKKRTNAHLHVHLMTNTPTVWASAAIEAGANTIILSSDTTGVKEAIQIIKKSGKRCGIAVNPDTSLKSIKDFLKDVDEVMVMSVMPGAAGQEFDETALNKIKILDNTRKKHGLRYLISVDGGINPRTAKLCWDSGANLLISGSYLAKAHDFPLAVQSLLKH